MVIFIKTIQIGIHFFKNQTIRLSKPLSYRGLTLVGISSPKNDGQRYFVKEITPPLLAV